MTWNVFKPSVSWLDSVQPAKGADMEEIRAWTTLVGASVAFAAGLWQYRRAQQWKRAEWVAAEMRTFFDDPRIMNALHMLDWNRRELPLLLSTSPNPQSSSFTYTADQLLHALTSRTNPQQRPYKPEEYCIRDCFDRLLDALERFESFIKARLVKHKDLDPYLAYWMRLLGDRSNGRKSAETMDRLWTYIDDYRFSGVQSLLGRFAYDITPRTRSSTASLGSQQVPAS